MTTLQHLGFNGGQGGVTITEDLIKDLEEAIKKWLLRSTLPLMVFSGDNNFRKSRSKEYKAQDEEFLKWAKEQVKAGRKSVTIVLGKKFFRAAGVQTGAGPEYLGAIGGSINPIAQVKRATALLVGEW